MTDKTTRPLDDERSLFEAHFTTEGWREHSFERYNIYDPKDERSYKSRHVSAMWEGWQARAALAQQAAQAATTADYKPWYDAVTDACVVAGELPWSENDARGTVNKLIDWHVVVALDPKVSEDAAALLQQGAAQAAHASVDDAKDAERWRWFVDHGFFWRSEHCIQTCWPRHGEIGAKDPSIKKEAIINEAIDAARSAQASQKGESRG